MRISISAFDIATRSQVTTDSANIFWKASCGRDMWKAKLVGLVPAVGLRYGLFDCIESPTNFWYFCFAIMNLWWTFNDWWYFLKIDSLKLKILDQGWLRGIFFACLLLASTDPTLRTPGHRTLAPVSFAWQQQESCTSQWLEICQIQIHW